MNKCIKLCLIFWKTRILYVFSTPQPLINTLSTICTVSICMCTMHILTCYTLHAHVLNVLLVSIFIMPLNHRSALVSWVLLQRSPSNVSQPLTWKRHLILLIWLTASETLIRSLTVHHLSSCGWRCTVVSVLYFATTRRRNQGKNQKKSGRWT